MYLNFHACRSAPLTLTTLQPLNKAGIITVFLCTSDDIRVSCAYMCISPHPLIIKDYGFLTGFTLAGNYKVPIFRIFPDDFLHACPVFSSERFVHAAFHYIEEIIQYGYVCNGTACPVMEGTERTVLKSWKRMERLAKH